MKIYLVGGAVRDELMGRDIKERDWVVLGATPEAMIAQGYKPVGKDFPVFLHPKTKEEYALARTERKHGKGYKGFTFYCAPDVTLEMDLARRDLTINAMAKSPDGTIIDPFGGQAHLKDTCLHHVSDAFSEDPVRILRTARFAAYFSNFDVHADTINLMRVMVAAGEVHALVAERVWQELERALSAPTPVRFFEVIMQCGAAPVLFVELDLTQLDLDALRRATTLSKDGAVRLAASLTNQTNESVMQLANRFRFPKTYTDLLTITLRHIQSFRAAQAASPTELVSLLETLDAFRRPKRFQQFLLAAQAACDNQTNAKAIVVRLQKAYKKTAGVQAITYVKQGYQGPDIAKAVHCARVDVLANSNTIHNCS